MAAEKHQQEAVKTALAQNKTLSMLDEILEDVRKAADRLEEEIEEHAFDNNKQVGKQQRSQILVVCRNSCFFNKASNCASFHTHCLVDERSKCRGGVESGG